MKRIGILGSSGLLCESLTSINLDNQLYSVSLFQHRTPLNKFSNQFQIYSDPHSFFCDIDLLISFIPIWSLVELLSTTQLEPSSLQKIIAISSTSAFTKIHSSNNWELNYAKRFLSSESSLSTLCNDLCIPLCIVRPTMIWGHCRDSNVTFIQRFICRFGFFILPSYGSGLRWPIHHSDLLEIIFNLIGSQSHGTFIARGSEEITYRDMVNRIFFWHKLSPLIITLPPHLVGPLSFLVRHIASKPYINSASFKRIDKTEQSILTSDNTLLSRNKFQPLFAMDVLSPSRPAKYLNTFFHKLICILPK